MFNHELIVSVQRLDNPEGSIGEGKNTLGMHVLSKYIVDVVEDQL